ncbi:MAG TPA: chemotaxis protein CheB [Actinomycetota bacterium]|nr:chemotaxis protein CheB [Actinomycetota bacterium]
MAPSAGKAPRYAMVVIGGSAGALGPMRMVLSGLPPGFGAALAIVLHRVPEGPSLLREILGRKTALEVVDATEGTRMAPGRVLIAPADRNLVLEPESAVGFRVGETHHLRSAIDPVLESAARVYGAGAIALILSGGGHDGAEGCRAVHDAGGTVVVQDPATAVAGDMPRSVIATGVADVVCDPAEMAGILMGLVSGGSPADVVKPRGGTAP